MIEEWKDIAGYEGLYKVSNTGRVMSTERISSMYGGRKYIKPQVILKSSNDKDGYQLVTLYKSGRKTSKKVHRLVAEAFISNPNNLLLINHKDENKKNNNVSNLEWCTYKYNVNYGTSIERMLQNRDLSEKALKQQKRVKMLSKDKELIRIFDSIKKAASYIGICSCTISNCCNGRLQTAGGYVWEYDV